MRISALATLVFAASSVCSIRRDGQTCTNRHTHTDIAHGKETDRSRNGQRRASLVDIPCK